MRDWVVDVTFHKDGNLLCFVPVEDINTPKERIITGLNLLTTLEGFYEGNHGNLRGFVHLDGQDVLNNWLKSHQDIVNKAQEVRNLQKAQQPQTQTGGQGSGGSSGKTAIATAEPEIPESKPDRTPRKPQRKNRK